MIVNLTKCDIIGYIVNLGEIYTMNLESITHSFRKCSNTQLLPDCHPSISQIGEPPFYIAPQFLDYTHAQNSRFILFSAPGATGKSALAKYLSYTFNGLLWDLSKIRIGENSFTGTIIQSIGNEQYSDFIKRLNNSDALLVIDAFDEAEMISGRKMINSFILEINKSVSGCVTPQVILLARTETAQAIAAFCKENKIAISHYEIGFFTEGQAKEFVISTLNNRGKRVTPAKKECVVQYFTRIRQTIRDENEINSFIGYAPVLETIATDIGDEDNTAKILSSLQFGTHSIDFVSNIMLKLLERESGKVKSAFQLKCETRGCDFDQWQSLYSEEEQLVRIMYYIIFNDIDAGFNPNRIPAALFPDYLDILQGIIPQHPFLQQRNGSLAYEFTGPAFRDYAIAKLFSIPEYNYYADWYIENLSTGTLRASYFPSQLLWEYYNSMFEGKVFGDQIAYLFESFKAKAKGINRPSLSLGSEDTETGPKGYAVFSMFDLKKPKAESESKHLELIVDKDHPIVFDQLVGSNIDLPNEEIVLGHYIETIRINNSNIICKKLIICKSKLVIEAYSNEQSLIATLNPLQVKNQNNLQVEVVAEGRIMISLPNISHFPKLYPFMYDFNSTTEIDIIKYMHALRRIFIEFRAHKKDTLAKDADRIDLVIRASNELKDAVFVHLIERNVFRRDAHLYKINKTAMSEFNISWMAISQGDCIQLEPVFNDFKSWYSQK